MEPLKEIYMHALVITIFVATVYPQDTTSSGLCEASRDCKSCITAHPDCVWCSATSLPERTPRCFSLSSNTTNCTDYLVNPRSKVQIIKDAKFTNPKNETTDTIIQMRPQNLTVKLRKGQTTKVNITFKKVIDYPLDLYYVMDLSNSMNDDLATLQRLGAGLLTSIKNNITENVQVGFGSFVDKVMMPFTSTVTSQLQNPCSGGTNVSNCAPPFGFRHQLPITGNATAFQIAVQGTRVSGNIDIPEGSFDALMQIAVCEEFIKWRQGSMKVILLTTDATPHIAMDGKLAAILEANDMKCHLEANVNNYYAGELVYAKSKTLDYPSLGQLKEAFTKHKVRSIFAVTKDVLPLYQEIPKVLKELGTVSQLADDSRNIIPLIQSTYNEIRGRLVVRATDAPSHVTFTQRTYCHTGEINDAAMDCNNINIGDTVVFELSFTANKCLNQKDRITLTSSSLTDVVAVDLEYICDCECQEHDMSNSSYCNSYGNVTCGLCTCQQGREGSKCQCESAKPGENPLVENCTKEGSTKGVCEGQGQCDCGKCKCNDGFEGGHCECKTTGCPSRNQQLCGGTENGLCRNCPDKPKENHCECINDFTKASDDTCSCHTKFCLTQDGQNCTGNGDCNCDKCDCKDKWTGKYCQRCIDPTCSGLSASCADPTIRECAKCRSKSGSDECKSVCTHPFLLVNTRDSLPTCDCPPGRTSSECTDCRTHDNNIEVPGTCVQYFPDSCSYSYKMFWTNNDRFYVYVKSFDVELDCPKPVQPIVIILPTVGAVVLLGIILLIMWKLYTMRRDRIEWEKFVKERESSKWTQSENPIWKKAEDKFTNPMFDATPE